ncbi:MAG: hypothetical protein E7232_14005 [Lachnospiraceae bacterium]|jgi:hypothetical protein|nr:hypothetical protein [Lachnospiraceae bacterium]
MLKRKVLALLAIAAALMMFSVMTSFASGWHEDEYGWWYEADNSGSYYYDGMYTIGGKQYVFDDYGYVITNQWIQFTDGTWSYCTGSGAVAKNCWIGDYYVDSNGEMLTNTYTPDGYYVGADGRYVSSSGVSSIPTGNWWSVGYNGDTQDYRVDAWVFQGSDGLNINFGHYEPSGSPYDFYSKTNPNGDNLVLYESDGQIYGKSTKSGGGTYKIDYDGTKLTIHWVNTTWNRGGKNITLWCYDENSGGGVG